MHLAPSSICVVALTSVEGACCALHIAFPTVDNGGISLWLASSADAHGTSHSDPGGHSAWGAWLD